MTTNIEQLKALNPKYIQLLTCDLFPDNNPTKTATIFANIMMNIVQPKLDNEGTSWSELDYFHYDYREVMYSCAKAQAAGILESRHVRKILDDCFGLPYVGYHIGQYCKESGLLDELGGNSLLPLVTEAIANNPKAVEELKSGKEKAIGALVGSIMKKQKANPIEIQTLIKTELGLL